MEKPSFYISDIGGVRTPKVYYAVWKFENYEIISYTPKNGVHHEPYLDDELKQALNTFDQENKSEYIVGVGRPINLNPSNDEPLTLERLNSTYQSSEDVALLQRVLTLGRKLSIDGKWRNSYFTEKEKQMGLEFCVKNGLNRIDGLSMQYEIRPYPPGFNLWSFFQGMQSLYVAYERMINLLKTQNIQDHNLALATTECYARLTSQSYYSKETGRIQNIIFADSLLDLARYQLGIVMERNGNIRKCANPFCNEMIVAGRSDKKTCSHACRQALSVINKKSLGRSGENGQHKG